MQLAFSKHLFIGTRHVVNKSGTSKKKKKETIILHTKIVEKFGKSWVLLIHLSQLGHIID